MLVYGSELSNVCALVVLWCWRSEKVRGNFHYLIAKSAIKNFTKIKGFLTLNTFSTGILDVKKVLNKLLLSIYSASGMRFC